MKKSFYSLLSMLLMISVLFTSCGTEKKTQAPQKKADMSVTETIKATNPEKLPDVAKNRKDTIIIGTLEMEGKFLPAFANTSYDSYVSLIIFDGLMSNDEKGSPVENLAEKYEISPDGKTYTFNLRKGVKFTNGDELTADDVEFTYLMLADPKYDGTKMDFVSNLVGYEEYNKGNAAKISGIKVIDKYTISFTEKKVKATALVSDFVIGIMPKKVYDFKKGDIAKVKEKLVQPVGSGAFIFKEYKPGVEVSLDANPNYWKGAPKIKHVIYKRTTAETNIQELKSGGVDIDAVPAKPENVQMLKDAGFIDLQFFPDNGFGYIGLNCRNEMFKDKKVRKALAYGLNRKGFIDAYFNGYATLANAPVSTVSWAYTDDIEKYEFNPEKANQLLDEAGWKKGNDGFRYKDGKKFTIHWMTSTGRKYVTTLIPIVKENWGKLGIEVIPELMDFGTLCTKVYDKQDFEMYNMAWGLAVDPDPSSYFSIKQATLGGYNSVGWTTPESEKLLEEGLSVTDQNKRKEIYNKWFKIVNDELPYIFLEQSKTMFAVSARVKGINVSSFRSDFTYDLYRAELVDVAQK